MNDAMRALCLQAGMPPRVIAQVDQAVRLFTDAEIQWRTVRLLVGAWQADQA